MKRLLLALLIGALIFAGSMVLLLITGSYLEVQATPKDASGLPTGPATNLDMVAELAGIWIVVSVLVALAGAVAYWLRGRAKTST